MWNLKDDAAEDVAPTLRLRLFHACGVRSQGVLIALIESGLHFDLVPVGSGARRTAFENGLTAIDPFVEAPVLLLPNGSTFREPAAIMELVADLVPSRHLVPIAGTLDRILLTQWMHFISGQIGLGVTEDTTSLPATRSIGSRLAWIDLHLSTRNFLMGPTYSIADMHLWVRVNAIRCRKHEMIKQPNLERWFAEIADRPAVTMALAA